MSFFCPFCDKSGEALLRCDPSGWRVYCDSCGASGPSAEKPEEAAAQWRRATHEKQLFRTVIDESPDVIIIKNREGQFLLGNRTLASLYGTTPEQLIGKSDADFNDNQEQVDFYLKSAQEVIRSGETQIVRETSTDAVTGEVRHFQSIKKPLKMPTNESCILIIAHDMTELLLAHQKVEEREKRYDYAMSAAGEGIWDWDLRTNVVSHNKKWCEIFSIEPPLLQHPVEFFSDMLHEEDQEEVFQILMEVVEDCTDKAIYAHEHRMRAKDGRIVWVYDRGRVVERDEEGNALRMVGSLTDITERKQSEIKLELVRAELAITNSQLEAMVAERTTELAKANKELYQLARRDSLTGLSNRLAANEMLEQEFVRYVQTKIPYTVLLIDIDFFKRVNDLYGHPVGDRVLIDVAHLLRGHLRKGDFVARFGGEEFLVILPASMAGEGFKIAESLRLAVERAGLEEVDRLTISIGVASSLIDHLDMMDIVHEADEALYQAKRGGRNLSVLYHLSN